MLFLLAYPDGLGGWAVTVADTRHADVLKVTHGAFEVAEATDPASLAHQARCLVENLVEVAVAEPTLVGKELILAAAERTLHPRRRALALKSFS